MPRISQQKKDKISEQILHYLFSISPEAKFTAEIAKEVARDEEFTKILLSELKKKNLILEVNKNPQGAEYQKRQRWRLTDLTFNAYSNQQNNKQ